MEFKLGLVIVTIVISLIAYKLKALKLSGALSAMIVGILILIGVGIQGMILLGAFFVSSSFWSRWKQNDKSETLSILEKGDERDWAQVFANGGIPALLSFIYSFNQDPILLLLFSISLAAANADTWASEIGVLSKSDPILIHNLKRVKRGTSGAVSILGTTASFLASLMIAGLSFILWNDYITLNLVIVITIFGFLNMIIDTVLGSTIQRKNRCTICHAITESHIHCDTETKYARGIRFINNDVVNITSIAITVFLSIWFINVN